METLRLDAARKAIGRKVRAADPRSRATIRTVADRPA
jgi:hypothetical protein